MNAFAKASRLRKTNVRTSEEDKGHLHARTSFHIYAFDIHLSICVFPGIIMTMFNQCPIKKIEGRLFDLGTTTPSLLQTN